MHHHAAFGAFLAVCSPIACHVSLTIVKTGTSVVYEQLVYVRIKKDYSFATQDKLYEFIACSAAMIVPHYTAVRIVKLP